MRMANNSRRNLPQSKKVGQNIHQRKTVSDDAAKKKTQAMCTAECYQASSLKDISRGRDSIKNKLHAWYKSSGLTNISNSSQCCNYTTVCLITLSRFASPSFKETPISTLATQNNQFTGLFQWTLPSIRGPYVFLPSRVSQSEQSKCRLPCVQHGGLPSSVYRVISVVSDAYIYRRISLTHMHQ